MEVSSSESELNVSQAEDEGELLLAMSRRTEVDQVQTKTTNWDNELLAELFNIDQNSGNIYEELVKNENLLHVKNERNGDIMKKSNNESIVCKNNDQDVLRALQFHGRNVVVKTEQNQSEVSSSQNFVLFCNNNFYSQSREGHKISRRSSLDDTASSSSESSFDSGHDTVTPEVYCHGPGTKRSRKISAVYSADPFLETHRLRLNARQKVRVTKLNNMFEVLNKVIPEDVTSSNSRINSKLGILRRAILYIQDLQEQL